MMHPSRRDHTGARGHAGSSGTFSSATRRSSALRPGVSLLEAVLALALLSIASMGLAAAVADGGAAVSRSIAREQDLLAASRFLELVVLWPASDLERRLGTRQQGPWYLTIERRSPVIYDIVLADSNHRPLLQTATYRPPVAFERQSSLVSHRVGE